MSDSVRTQIKTCITQISAFDQIETEQIAKARAWIDSGAEIFRINKDAIPPKHLVSYALVVDIERKKVLLFDHKKAQLKLPSGGHVKIDELPIDAAKRELQEELGLSLNVYSDRKQAISVPYFLTITNTVSLSKNHTDVSLWYVFEGDSTIALNTHEHDYSKEFEQHYWMTFTEVLSTSISLYDPHMHRVIHKITNNIHNSMRRRV